MIPLLFGNTRYHNRVYLLLWTLGEHTLIVGTVYDQGRVLIGDTTTSADEIRISK